jgi:LacI family repressor for deo operon, udp, cdd, tsx, nupC, and nupG
MSQPDIVSPGTRHKVLQAVEDLGYTPNSAARHLRTLRSGKLLVTVPDISNPFFALILQGIEDAAHRDGYAVLLGDTQHDETREERYALMLRRKEADGLIFLGHRPPEAAQAFIRSIAPRCAPVVNSCEFSPRLGVPVSIDNARRHPARSTTSIAWAINTRDRDGPLVSPAAGTVAGVKTRAKLGGAEPDLEIVTGTSRSNREQKRPTVY